jgi:hypothetical protein
MIICEDLFRRENIKEVRELAKEYYIGNLANTAVFNKDAGTIYFSSKGYKKPISFSGGIRKVILFPYLKEIIEGTKLIKTKKDKKEQRNIFILYIVLLNREKIIVRINLKKDNRGIIYYDHFICQ